ncbi:MAG: dihydrolipoyl dehydrogenase [Nanoarchaeota archaeon]|nr:dihydrolipoyl dehydrogenase [Nanoarchaeota archaeon]
MITISENNNTSYNTIVIGSGPAGYTCAIRLAQLGAKVACLEKEFAGGVCTNWGCIPTKAMITAAKTVDMLKKAKRFGITVNDYSVDFAGLAKHRNLVVSTSRRGIEGLLKANNVEFVNGEAKILSSTEIKINEQVLKTENIVIATGSSPIVPGFISLSENVITSKQLLQMDSLPESIIIVGGGVIGLEFATLFSHLGTEVTVVEMLDTVLNNFDRDIPAELEKQFTRKGVKLLTKHKVLSVEDQKVKVQNLENNEELELTAEKILIAIGRKPNVIPEMLDPIGLKYDRTGITVDDSMRTNIPNIYAIGDITGKSILAHVGIAQGVVAAEAIMGKTTKMEYTVPGCIYTLPEVATVGLKEDEVENALIGRFPLIVNGRARGEVHTEGFVKVVIKDDLIVGAHMVGHNTTELISEAAVAIKNRIPAKDVMNTIHPHPTYSECFKGAIEDAYGEAIDLAPKKE